MRSELMSMKLAAIAAASVFGLMMASAPGAAHAASKGTHFKASGPDFTSGEAEDELRSTLEFEERAAETPVGRDSLSFFSICRGVPGNVIPTYAPIAPPEADAIVGDTPFFFADGTSCYNPQNESNIVVNPASLAVAANDKVKTDRRDSKRLAVDLADGRLRGIYVPTEEEELARLLPRTRAQLVEHRATLARQIKAKLHQFGLIAPSSRRLLSHRY